MNLASFTAAVLCLLGSWSPALAAVPAVATERLRESEQHQAQLSADAYQLVSALDLMLAEYARNGLGGQEVTAAQNLRGSIERLSTAEMRQVIDLLQRARAIQDPGASTKTVADAFTAQKQIAVAIQRILAEHARRQQALELATLINDLADRQARNLQNGIELGRMAGATKPGDFAAVMQAQLETQRGEQDAIAEELKVITQRLVAFAADPENAELAERFQAAAAQVRGVQPRAEAAEQALRAGQLFKAVGEERINRDTLRTISRAIAPRERGHEALRQAERELAELIREQESLMAETGKQKADTDFEKWIEQRLADIDPNRTLAGEFRRLSPTERKTSPALRAKFDAEQRMKGTELAKLEDEQSELAGRNDHLASNLPEAPAASHSLKNATAAMQEARSAMQEADAPTAQQQQATAMDRMLAAHEDLKRRADEAELLAASSGDKVQDLDRLRTAVEGLAKEEAALAQTGRPDRVQQTDIAQRAARMAQRGAELAPAAAPALREAAAHADNARAALEKNDNEPARQEAAQAARQLANAAQQIAQELAAAQKAEEQFQIAQAALAELAKLIAAEQKLQLDTGRAIATRNPEDLRALSSAQAGIEQGTTAFKASLGGGMIGVVQALNDAENAMQGSQTALEKANGAAALPAQAQAIAALFAAQARIRADAEAARNTNGEQFADAAAMAEAANRIEQAMQEVAAGQESLEQAANEMGRQAAQTAAQAAERAAQAARQAADAAQGAQQQAQQAGNQDAAQPAATAAAAAQQAAQAASQAAQAAREMAAQTGPAGLERAQQAAKQAGQAVQAAMQAAEAAGRAQQAAQAAGAAPANQSASEQAATAQQAARQAARAAQEAQSMANAAALAAQAGSQATQQAMAQAAGQLSEAAMQAAQAAAEQAGSPTMQQAAQAAAQQLANAANQAMQGQNAAAQETAQTAAQQLAQAAGMAQAAQAGISQPSAGQMPGQGAQGEMPGQGMKGAGKQPGEGQGSGPTKESNQPSEGATGYQAGSPEAIQRAARQAAIKNAGFLGLPARERAAIQQSLSERYPEEFGPMVEQYLLNLANEPARK